jgi:hypothetical protein
VAEWQAAEGDAAFRLLGAEDLDAFAALHDEIRASAAPGALSRRGRDEFARLLDSAGTAFALGVFVDGRLAGFSCASRWRPADAPRFEALGLPRARWDGTAVLAATGVAAWARGRGLQRRLVVERARRLDSIGASHGAGLIHAANLRSLSNVLLAGEPLRAVLDDEDGANYVCWRVAARQPRPLAQAPWLALPAGAIDAHRAAFARGLWCWALEGRPGGKGPVVLRFAAPDPGCT